MDGVGIVGEEERFREAQRGTDRQRNRETERQRDRDRETETERHRNKSVCVCACVCVCVFAPWRVRTFAKINMSIRAVEQ